MRYNAVLPAWMIGVAIFAIGLTGPAVRMLNLESVYEAAVAGEQFFFIGGCYWYYSALNTNRTGVWRIVLAAVHWALAIGTRITILPAAAFLAAAILFDIWRENPSSRSISKRVLASLILAPFAILAIGLGGYNYARFGSVFETGFKYQLANANYQEFTQVFSLDYVYGNFLIYFLRPMATQATFPYFRLLEAVQSNERIAGLVYTTPFFLLAFPALIRFLISGFSRQRIWAAIRNGIHRDTWPVLALTGSAIIMAGVVLVYYYPAVRFMEEFVPSLMLLTTLSLGKTAAWFGQGPVSRKAFSVFVFVLVVVSISITVLGTVPAARIKPLYLFIRSGMRFFGIG